VYKLDDEADDYVPYVPVAERRREKLAKLAARGSENDSVKQDEKAADEAREAERRRERERRQKILLVEAQAVHSQKAAEGTYRFARLDSNLPRCQKNPGRKA
jgi:ATP-dependent RNA helicase DDX41